MQQRMRGAGYDDDLTPINTSPIKLTMLCLDDTKLEMTLSASYFRVSTPPPNSLLPPPPPEPSRTYLPSDGA